MMNDFVKAANASDIPDPGKVTVEVGERLVVLIHAGGSFYCLDDVCTHDGGPLGEGELADDGGQASIACPRHGARFDVRTGRALTMPATESTAVHDVRVEGGEVYVRINDA